jgi:hypothetical protein
LWERIAARLSLIHRTLELEACRSGRGESDLRSALTEVDGLQDLIARANDGSVVDEDINPHLAQIAGRRFQLPDGTEQPYLTDEELHYLALRRGTLDDVERGLVEHHVDATYRFLKSIPWPEDLGHLADYAYAHHEMLDGSGYPRHLHAKDIPIQARIITVADMFDALTQSDRPYKPALPAAEALDILRREAQEGRLDKALVDLLIQSRAYDHLVPRKRWW